MNDSTAFGTISPTTLADVLGREQVMDIGIRPLWPDVPRIAGPAFTVQVPAKDNLMVHAAIYRAAPGSIIVVQSNTVEYAVAGGNVLAVAKRNGIAGFVIDGVIRDLAEARAAGMPVFARGVIPIPGVKSAVRPLNGEITCGGVRVGGGDIVVADEEGIVVTPAARRHEVLAAAQAKSAKDDAETLDEWTAAHRAKIDALLAEGGFAD